MNMAVFIDTQSQLNSHSHHHCYYPLTCLTLWSNDLDNENDVLTSNALDPTETFEQNLTYSDTQKSKIIFKIDRQLNSKIALWNGGNMLRLQVDAMVHPTNERFERGSNLLTNALYHQAGPQLRKCLYNKLKYCPIGSIKITKGYSIIPHYIIHTASPHYKRKFHTASETALFNCYLHVLQAAKHYNFRTLAIGNLALTENNYPEMDGIHLGIRVIRRFMKSYPDAFDLVVFCMENQHQYDLYRSLLKLYFPRNHHEEHMESLLLPSNNGGPMGEPIIPERAIRIQENPIRNIHEINDSGLDSGDDGYYHSYSSSCSTDYGGSEINIDECRERLMELNYQQEFDDIDESLATKKRSSFASFFHHNHDIHKTSSSHIGSPENMLPHLSTQNLHHFDDYDSNDQLMLNEHKRQLKLERLLRKTRRMEKELSETVKERLYQCVFISAVDNGIKQTEESEVLIIIGRELAQLFYNEFHGQFDYILAHLLKLLDKISRHGHRQYVILYFHTMVDASTTIINSQNQNNNNGNHNKHNNDTISPPKTQLLSRIYDFLSNQHREALKTFYVIHPSVFNRLYVWWLKTFYCKFLKNKVVFVTRLQQLKNQIGELHWNVLPKFIIEYELSSPSSSLSSSSPSSSLLTTTSNES